MSAAATEPMMMTASVRRTLWLLRWIMVGSAVGLTFFVAYGCFAIAGSFSRGFPAFVLPVPLLLWLAMSARNAARATSGRDL